MTDHPGADPSVDPRTTNDAVAAQTGARLRLGFARGIAPGKWERRWRETAGTPLELLPLEIAFGRVPGADAQIDVMLERVGPGEVPAGSTGELRTHHALRLYTEAIALVVAADHELADAESIDPADLELVRLLDHPDHPQGWPSPEQWGDPEWAPTDVFAALDLVATGTGAILLPRPLARHISRKRDHAIIPVIGGTLTGTGVWASWDLARDAADVQQLAGILRGRTSRSSRGAGVDAAQPGATSTPPRARSAQQVTSRASQTTGKKALKPNSRGAQLAAAQEKAERERAARRRAKRR